jgi:hypothetical protein
VGWVYDHRHRDLRALGRYGPPPEVVAAIDAEVLSGRCLARLGTLQTYLSPVPDPGEMYGHQVLLTETWLLDFYRYEGDRFNALRLTDLVWATRESTSRRAKLILIDRHDTRLEIFGTPAAVSRLLAEVLARVPWVLERFDPQSDPAARPGRADPDAEVEDREAIRRADVRPGPPPPPPPEARQL